MGATRDEDTTDEKAELVERPEYGKFWLCIRKVELIGITVYMMDGWMDG